ncbi:hypothetical protein CYY_006195 [Polysphondylium violaceum]|uniref:Aminotransferase class I/classII large domain-containing protein n=1 Tax=Polysphondylium violaceum TaxID=133409 RepID=A0A8J4PSM7_9MYCE|nr:hypothetical protein CYY_006195 [Polysphondylium violaceum]
MDMNNQIKDYSTFISKRGSLKKPSPIREIIQLVNLPGMISLGGGLPNNSTFPFKSLTVELKDGTSLELKGSDLDEALQYSASYGLVKLNKWLKDLQVRNHKLNAETAGKEWNLLISNGSQEAISMAIEVLCDDGDSIISEQPTYSGTLSILRPLQLNIVGIEIDQFGMIPSKLEDTLANWDHSKHKFPRVIYLIPTGQNPSGSTMNLERKKALYNICSKYNLLIFEDDPYYYLQFGELNDNSSDTKLDLGESLISMDVDGRVLRFDSFSKILSSGLRLGFVTGPQYLVEKIQFHEQSASLHASGLSQAVAQALLYRWGFENWDKHLLSIQNFYRQRRNTFISLIEKHLKGLVEYNAPTAGMFVWMKLNGVTDTKSLISEKAIEKKVLLVPGIAFYPDQTQPSPYVRASFSVATEEQMDEALKRLSSLIKDQ